MRKILLLIITVVLVLKNYGQDEVKLIPIELEKTFKESVNGNQIYSKKNKNTISIEVNPQDKDKAEKAQRKIIKLYAQNGSLLATSEPMNLYDWTVKPLGDDNTVLVIFPAGTYSKAIIKIYKKKGNKLTSVKTIERRTSYFNIDIANNANHFICGFSSWSGESEYPELVYYDSNGNAIQSYTVDEKYLYTLKVTSNHLIATSHDLSNRTKFVYLFDISGNRLMKKELYEIVGNDIIETSDYADSRYFGIANAHTVQLFDSKQKKEIEILKIHDKAKNISSYIIDQKGTIFATAMKKTFSKESRNYIYTEQILIVKSPDKLRQIIKIEDDGRPKVKIENGKLLLEIINNKNEKIKRYEIQY